MFSNKHNIFRGRKKRQAADNDEGGPILGLISSLLPRSGRSGEGDGDGPIQILLNIIRFKLNGIQGLLKHLGNLLGGGDSDGEARSGGLGGLLGNLLDP